MRAATSYNSALVRLSLACLRRTATYSFVPRLSSATFSLYIYIYTYNVEIIQAPRDGRLASLTTRGFGGSIRADEATRLALYMYIYINETIEEQRTKRLCEEEREREREERDMDEDSAITCTTRG